MRTVTRLGIIISGFLAAACSPEAALQSACDRQCLLDIMGRFVNEMTARSGTTVPVSPNAEIRENGG